MLIYSKLCFAYFLCLIHLDWALRNLNNPRLSAGYRFLPRPEGNPSFPLNSGYDSKLEDLINSISILNKEKLIKEPALPTKNRIIPPKEQIIKITEDEWEEMQKSEDLNDFLRNLAGLPEEEIRFSRPYHTGQKDDDNNYFRTPKLAKSSHDADYWTNPTQALCKPEMKTINLGYENHEGVHHFPTCVRAQRCAGCCSNKLHECQPIAQRDITIKITKISKLRAAVESNYVRSRRRGRRRRTSSAKIEHFNETIVEHTQCDCLCKLKEIDCDLIIHKYNDKTCNCDCRNKDDETKCLKDHEKFWNESTCSCECRNKKICSTGMEFNNKTCSCRRIAKPAPIYDYYDILDIA